MNTPNFALICWGDYLLDGRIVPFIQNKIEIPIIEELEEIIDYYVDLIYQNKKY